MRVPQSISAETQLYTTTQDLRKKFTTLISIWKSVKIQFSVVDVSFLFTVKLTMLFMFQSYLSCLFTWGLTAGWPGGYSRKWVQQTVNLTLNSELIYPKNGKLRLFSSRKAPFISNLLNQLGVRPLWVECGLENYWKPTSMELSDIRIHHGTWRQKNVVVLHNTTDRSVNTCLSTYSKINLHDYSIVEAIGMGGNCWPSQCIHLNAVAHTLNIKSHCPLILQGKKR